jgi:hypothetical protein
MKTSQSKEREREREINGIGCEEAAERLQCEII